MALSARQSASYSQDIERRSYAPDNRLLDRLSERLLLAGQRLQIQTGCRDAFMVGVPLDLAGLGSVLLYGPGKGVAQPVDSTGLQMPMQMLPIVWVVTCACTLQQSQAPDAHPSGIVALPGASGSPKRWKPSAFRIALAKRCRLLDGWGELHKAWQVAQQAQ